MTSIDPFAPANDFYAWTGDLTDYDNGHLLRSEALTDGELIPIASQGWRMLYVSTGHDGQKVAVSGLVFLPAGGAPASNGRPVISYAHGTTGITAAAAPSLNPNAQVLGYPILGELSTFLSVGYAVVCTDYEGLGTAGPHPYCHGKSLAHSQIHAVTAGMQVSDELSNVWVAMGQSEGGQSTMFSAKYATTFAPELDYRGAVATAPPTEWPTLMAQTSALGRVLTPGLLHAVSYYDPALHIEELLNDDGRTLLDAWRTSFLLEPGTVMDTFAPLEGKPLFNLAAGEKTDSDASQRLAATLDFSELEVPRGRLDRPVLLAEGGRDEFCVPGTITRLAEDLRTAGTQVEHHTYPQYSHLDIPFVAFPETLPFVQRIAPITLPHYVHRVSTSAPTPDERAGTAFLTRPGPAGHRLPIALATSPFRQQSPLRPRALYAAEQTVRRAERAGTRQCEKERHGRANRQQRHLPGPRIRRASTQYRRTRGR